MVDSVFPVFKHYKIMRRIRNRMQDEIKEIQPERSHVLNHRTLGKGIYNRKIKVMRKSTLNTKRESKPRVIRFRPIELPLTTFSTIPAP